MSILLALLLFVLGAILPAGSPELDLRSDEGIRAAQQVSDVIQRNDERTEYWGGPDLVWTVAIEAGTYHVRAHSRAGSLTFSVTDWEGDTLYTISLAEPGEIEDTLVIPKTTVYDFHVDTIGSGFVAVG